MLTVSVVVEDGYHERRSTSYAPTFNVRDRTGSVLWCEACCDQIGVMRLRKMPEQPSGEIPRPLLEDAVREIIHDVLAER